MLSDTHLIFIYTSVGFTTPSEFRDLIKYLRVHVEGIEDVTLSVHGHNDLGMAVANFLGAIEVFGSQSLSCSFSLSLSLSISVALSLSRSIFLSLFYLSFFFPFLSVSLSLLLSLSLPPSHARARALSLSLFLSFSRFLSSSMSWS